MTCDSKINVFTDKRKEQYLIKKIKRNVKKMRQSG